MKYIFPVKASYYKSDIFIDRYLGATVVSLARKYKVSQGYLRSALSVNGKWFDEYQEFREIMNNNLRVPPSIGGLAEGESPR